MPVAKKSIERGPPAPARVLRLPGFAHFVKFFTQDAWRRDRVDSGNVLFRAARVAYLAARGFFVDNCLSRASALTYITVLSLVPLLAFAFSVAKGFGFYDELLENTINPFLDRSFGSIPPGVTLDNLAATSATPENAPAMRVAIAKVLEFVQKTEVSALGFFGLALLLFTVIKLLATIEGSFNDIWGVHRARSVIRKISDYMAMVLVTPIFLFVATGVTTAAQNSQFVTNLRVEHGLDAPIGFVLSTIPILSLWVGFTFIYMAMPNTRTRIVSAIIGALVAAILWQIALVLHLKFQIGIARYNAIYSSFAAFPIFLIWINLSWVIVLLGAEIAFAHQSEPSYAHVEQAELEDHAYKERLGLRAMTRIAQRFLKGEEPWSASTLALELCVPQRVLEEVLYACADGGLLVDSYRGEARAFLPARDLESITVKMILDTLKGTSQKPAEHATKGCPEDEVIDRILAGIDGEVETSRHNRTLRSLTEGLAREEAAVRAAAKGKRAVSGGEGAPARV
jgi:membrane protein